MINKPNNWDNTAAVIGSGYKNLPAGNYKCKIVGCETTQSRSGNQMLKIAFDVVEGEYSGIYMERFENAKKANTEAKYPAVGIYYQLLGDEHTGRLKGLIQCLEMSNPHFKWGWDEKALKGLFFAGQFREEEYYNQNGELRSSTKLVNIYPLEELPNLDVLPKKQAAEVNSGSGNNGWGNAFGNAAPASDIPF